MKNTGSAQGAGGRWLPVLMALSVALLLGLAWWLAQGRDHTEAPEDVPEPASRAGLPDDPGGRETGGGAGRRVERAPEVGDEAAPGAQEGARPDDGCAPRASKVCFEGDEWWLDGCGRRQALARECGATLCRQGACEEVDPEACAGLGPMGRCDGQVAEVCHRGRRVRVDCGRAGYRCVVGGEGAECRRRASRPCDWGQGETRCEGDRLQACVEGELLEVDCATVEGRRCGLLPEAGIFGCMAVEMLDEAPPIEEECGACGCPPNEAPGPEVCDGRDNDGDGLVDHGAVCEPVEVVAYIVTDRRGEASHSEADVEAEVAALGALLGERDDGLGLGFVLVDVVRVAEPRWLVADDAILDAMVQDPRLRPGRANFALPMVLVDELYLNGTPHSGVSTLPNGACGGHRKADAPHVPLGLVVLAKGRHPTTGAHEVGHFLGLCHTHEVRVDAVSRVVAWPSGEGAEAQACQEPCLLEGDGLCDTPRDPGPAVCAPGAPCEAVCPDGADPDTSNLMSYYTGCRGTLTQEQALLMRRTLALRRGWHRCLEGVCPCDPLEAGACPEEMTCRPDGEGWRCGLDGPRAPGEPCRGLLDCGRGSFCVSLDGGAPRCARPCAGDFGGCRCQEAQGLEVSICRQDMTGGR